MRGSGFEGLGVSDLYCLILIQVDWVSGRKFDRVVALAVAVYKLYLPGLEGTVQCLSRSRLWYRAMGFGMPFTLNPQP